jgi:hypothetical protein
MLPHAVRLAGSFNMRSKSVGGFMCHKISNGCARLEVLMAVNMRSDTFWEVLPYTLAPKNKIFERIKPGSFFFSAADKFDLNKWHGDQERECLSCRNIKINFRMTANSK